MLKGLTICALSLSFVGVANAGQVIVYQAPLQIWNQGISADFAVNRELGRAWVDVQVEYPASGESVPEREVFSRAVEGLSYDAARKQVLYRTASGPVVCAEDAKFLWSTYLKSTGQCQLTARSEQRKEDDGFKMRDRTIGKVILETQTVTVSER